ncbi:hypothetical protein PHK61_28780 [Actinomycetospora lutea]|uniref:hypothetical protein n=1 Tax=Actinomycetospora lutea TaxID=663604 RepID=UPI002365D528|nr:hypothetical protein [Actinomycetospora lutea]MDD7942417.1 hypothetical protein [Actinomycetospora lutea]
MSDEFPPNSRYHHVPTVTSTLPDGTAVTHLSRRVLPATERHVPLEYRHLDGVVRLDALAAESYGDPYLWWRIVDASGEADPAALTGEPGRLVMVPLPLEVATNGPA